MAAGVEGTCGEAFESEFVCDRRLLADERAGKEVEEGDGNNAGPPGIAHIMTSRTGLDEETRLGQRTMERLCASILFEADLKETSCIKSALEYEYQIAWKYDKEKRRGCTHVGYYSAEYTRKAVILVEASRV